MNRPAVAACWVALASASVGAVQPVLDRRAIEEAIYVGQSRVESERTRFHAPYRIRVAQAPVDWIDVVTPFHRIELAAEDNARRGRRLFGQREALAILGDTPRQIDLILEMTFHPLNTFVGVPGYRVALLGAGGLRIEPSQLGRFPRFGPRMEVPRPVFPDGKAFGTGQPVVGGTIVAAFDGTTLDANGRYDVILVEGDRELVRSRIDFATMR
jgi:hypothetical protein